MQDVFKGKVPGLSERDDNDQPAQPINFKDMGKKMTDSSEIVMRMKQGSNKVSMNGVPKMKKHTGFGMLSNGSSSKGFNMQMLQMGGNSKKIENPMKKIGPMLQMGGNSKKIENPMKKIGNFTNLMTDKKSNASKKMMSMIGGNGMFDKKAAKPSFNADVNLDFNSKMKTMMHGLGSSNKGMDFEKVGRDRLMQQKGLSPLGDNDGDKLVNMLDCNPINPFKQGPEHGDAMDKMMDNDDDDDYYEESGNDNLPMETSDQTTELVEQGTEVQSAPVEYNDDDLIQSDTGATTVRTSNIPPPSEKFNKFGATRYARQVGRQLNREDSSVEDVQDQLYQDADEVFEPVSNNEPEMEEKNELEKLREKTELSKARTNLYKQRAAELNFLKTGGEKQLSKSEVFIKSADNLGKGLASVARGTRSGARAFGLRQDLGKFIGSGQQFAVLNTGLITGVGASGEPAALKIDDLTGGNLRQQLAQKKIPIESLSPKTVAPRIRTPTGYATQQQQQSAVQYQPGPDGEMQPVVSSDGKSATTPEGRKYDPKNYIYDPQKKKYYNIRTKKFVKYPRGKYKKSDEPEVVIVQTPPQY